MRLMQRARIVTMAGDGVSNQDIAREVGVSRPTVQLWRERFLAFARGAAVLVHDTMYTSDEYPGFVGWGHSTYEDAVELALEAKVKRLVLFHHHPERTDDAVDRCVERCRALVAARGGQLEVLAAAEGMTLTI